MKLFLFVLASLAAGVAAGYFGGILMVEHPKVFILIGVGGIMMSVVIIWWGIKTLRQINDEVQRHEEENYYE